MNEYTNQKSLYSSVNELKRIENMLKRHFPNIDKPEQMSQEHAMYVAESKRLRQHVQAKASSTYQPNPLENDFELQFNVSTIQSLKNQPPNNQSFGAHNQNDTSNNNFNPQSMFASNVKENRNGEVSQEERRRACESLKPNGCGGKGFWKGSWVPDKPGSFDFTKACNNHDRNYSTLGFGFERANRIFYNDMMAVPPKKAYRYTKSGKLIEYIDKPDEWAKNYYEYVSINGRPYYDEAQQNAYICKYGRRPE